LALQERRSETKKNGGMKTVKGEKCRHYPPELGKMGPTRNDKKKIEGTGKKAGAAGCVTSCRLAAARGRKNSSACRKGSEEKEKNNEETFSSKTDTM